MYVIDNNSLDCTPRLFDNEAAVTLVETGKNLGFGAAHNVAIKKGVGKYHFIINPDIAVGTDILSDMADFMEENPDVVLAMPNILNSDGSIQFLPKKIPTLKYVFLGRLSEKVRDEYVMKNELSGKTEEIDFCSGCFMCIKGDVFEKLGGFDERYFMYMEDVDLTLRAKKYGKTVIVPEFSVRHLWKRESAKSLKMLLIHTKSVFKFFMRKKDLLK